MSDRAVVVLELEKLGLTKNQAIIYMLLIDHKELRIQEIADRAHIPRSSVYESLKGLFNFGLVEEIIEDSYKVIGPLPIASVRHAFNEQIFRLKELNKSVDDLEKSITHLQTDNEPPTATIKYYRGVSGARQIFWNTLKATDTIYVISEYGRSKYLGKKFYMNFVSESYKRNIKEKILTNPTEQTISLIKRDTGTPLARSDTKNIRILPEISVPIKGDALIYNGIYAQVYLHNKEIYGFEIESRDFVDTQRSIFETLWATAEPITTHLQNKS